MLFLFVVNEGRPKGRTHVVFHAAAETFVAVLVMIAVARGGGSSWHAVLLLQMLLKEELALDLVSNTISDLPSHWKHDLGHLSWRPLHHVVLVLCLPM